MATQPIEHPGNDNPGDVPVEYPEPGSPGAPDDVPPVGPDFDQPDTAPVELPPPD